jgi:hypothetical protein
MNAADVIATVSGCRPSFHQGEIAALLAHGEQGQGVTIRAGGELVPEVPDGHTRIDGAVYPVEWAEGMAVMWDDGVPSLLRFEDEPGSAGGHR